MTTEQVTNGGLETGDFTGWTQFQANVTNSFAHTGTYSAFMYESWARQTFATPIAKSAITSAKFWAMNYNAYSPHDHHYKIGYSDETEDNITFTTTSPSNEFEEFDILSYIADGKSVSYIEFRGDTGQPYCLDDVSILISVTTVHTDAATSVKSSTATINGEITELGSGNCDERGFDWGISSGVYGFSWTETGSYGVSAFSRSIDTFGACITVYFRAKAHDSGGWHYGSELTLSFSLCSITNSYGALSCCNVIDVKMSETTKVAKRRVPKRATGEVVDYGTWTHEPMQLEITVRLSDSQKTTIEGIFNESATVTVTLTSDNGTWTFSGWLNAKEVAYDHSVDSNGISRPWRYRLAFNITSASFA